MKLSIILLLLILIVASCSTEPEAEERNGADGDMQGEPLGTVVLDERLEEMEEEDASMIEFGGPPPDGIPSIDHPQFERVEEASAWLEPQEPVVFVKGEETAKAYPLQVLMWHEIVNDVIDGVPAAVTYCPLCNSSFTFKREAGGETMTFGTTGYLHGGALMMYDRQTHSLWAHFGGGALSGPMTGTDLTIIPSSIISWEQFAAEAPDGEVLSRDTGYSRDYGANPYAGYDDIDESPFLFSQETDGQYPPMQRLTALEIEGEAAGYLQEDLEENRLIQDTVGGRDVILIHEKGTASGLDDDSVAGGRDIGSVSAFFRDTEEGPLTFHLEDGVIVDEQTGSAWSWSGRAAAGELEGIQLEAVPFQVDTFWFAWSTYRPDTRMVSGE